jgi:lipid A 4'-phosphatase
MHIPWRGSCNQPPSGNASSDHNFIRRETSLTAGEGRNRTAFLLMGALFVIGIAGTAVLEWSDLDRGGAALFYFPGEKDGGWALGRTFPWDVLYDYGELPGIALAVVCAALYGLTWMGKVPQRYAKPCLVVVLTVLLGPGLAVNGMLKEGWGRPRPADVALFGGQTEYRAVWQPGGPGHGKSFTCGHCAIAFAVSSGAALFPAFSSLWFLTLVSGFVYGLAMSLTRIVQGGHFPSDCLWSGVIVYLIFFALYYLVFRIPEEQETGQE